MPKPDPGAYRRAQLRAREILASRRDDIALTIRRDLEEYVAFLFRELEREGIDRATEQALRAAAGINERAAQNLLNALVNDTEGARGGIFEQTLNVWQSSGLQAARSAGVADATLASLRAPPVTLLAAFESVGAADNWRTLLRGHVSDAATEANAIVRRAMLEGVDRDELARRMRRYVVGAEQFEDAFTKVPTATGEVEKIDLRRLTGDERDAARQMEFNARRIASSELRNASHEAQVQHMIRDPLIIGVKWDLAPTHSDVDECDVLATADWYGLGPGVHRVDAVPAPPHPFDACLAGWSQVHTRDGLTEIRDVRVGDEVLTHKGRWSPVTELHHGPVTGDWYDLRLSDGRRLTVTGDHPVLTPSGWTQVENLSGGDLVVGVSDLADDDLDELSTRRTLVGGPSVSGKREQGPAALLKKVGLPSVLVALLLRPMPPSVDLDGDFSAGDSNVDVPPLQGPQRLGGDAAVAKLVANASFVLRKLGLILVNGLRSLSEGLDRLRSASERLAAFFCPTLAVEGVISLPRQLNFLRHTAPLDPHFIEASHDRWSAYVEPSGNLKYRNLFVDVEATDFLEIEIDSCRQLSSRLKRYCLTVAQDNSFVAGGIVVHNCSNRSIARSSAQMDQPKPTPSRRVTTESDMVSQVSGLRGLKRERASRIADRAERAVSEGTRRIQGAMQQRRAA